MERPVIQIALDNVPSYLVPVLESELSKLLTRLSTPSSSQDVGKSGKKKKKPTAQFPDMHWTITRLDDNDAKLAAFLRVFREFIEDREQGIKHWVSDHVYDAVRSHASGYH